MRFEIVAWDDEHAAAPMDARETPQASVNRYTGRPADCDLTLVILWSRIGTRLPPGLTRPDGSRYESGTVWEYEDALAADKPVFVYRRTEKPKIDLDDAEFDKKRAQYAAVKAFVGQFENPDGSLRAGFTTTRRPLTSGRSCASIWKASSTNAWARKAPAAAAQIDLGDPRVEPHPYAHRRTRPEEPRDRRTESGNHRAEGGKRGPAPGRDRPHPNRRRSAGGERRRPCGWCGAGNRQHASRRSPAARAGTNRSAIPGSRCAGGRRTAPPGGRTGTRAGGARRRSRRTRRLGRLPARGRVRAQRYLDPFFIGDLHLQLGDSNAAIGSYRSAWRPRGTVASDPSETGATATSRSATTRSATCWWRRATGRGRWPRYRKGLAIAEALAARDPANTEWQRDLSVSHDKIGDVLVAQGDRPGRWPRYRQALAIARGAGRARPGQHRVAARPLGQPQQDRRRAGGAGRPAGALAALSPGPRDRARRWPRATRPTPSGSATSRSATTRSATCWWRRATWPGRWPRYRKRARHRARRWPRATRPTPSGSATSRSATTRSATCWCAQGDLAGALAALSARASPSREALAARDPANTGWQRDLSVSHEQDRRRAGARRATGRGRWRAYRAGARDRARRWPRATRPTPSGSATSRSATTRSATCWSRRATGPGRSPRYQAGLAIRRGAGRARSAPTPSGSATSRSATSKIGDVLVAQGDRPGALAAYRAGPRHRRGAGRARPGQHRVAARPLGQPRQDRRRAGRAGRPARGARGLSPEPRHRRGAGRARSGQHRLAARPLGQPQQDRRRAGRAGRPAGGAGRAIARGLAIREALAARDPANTGWQRDLSVSHERIGDVLVAQGDGPGALAAYRRGSPSREALAARDPANAQWQGHGRLVRQSWHNRTRPECRDSP